MDLDKINYQFSRGWLVITKSLLSLVKELIYKAEVARVKARLALTPAGWLHCYLEVWPLPPGWHPTMLCSIHLHLTTLESPCQFNLAGMRFAAKNDANARDGKIWENLIFATLACFAYYHAPPQLPSISNSSVITLCHSYFCTRIWSRSRMQCAVVLEKFHKTGSSERIQILGSAPYSPPNRRIHHAGIQGSDQKVPYLVWSPPVMCKNRGFVRHTFFRLFLARKCKLPNPQESALRCPNLTPFVDAEE